jgi:HEAT repeat protein
MANKREFEGRMLAILDPGVERATPSRGQTLTLALGLGAVALSIAAVAPARREHSAWPAPMVASHSPRGDTTKAPPTSAPKSPRIRQAKPATNAAAPSTPSSSAAISLAANETAVPQQPRSADLDTTSLARILRNDKGAEVRRAAVWALRDRPDAAPLLLERLRLDPSDRVREMSAWALANFMSESVASALTNTLLADTSPYVRGTAAWALGHSRDAAQTAALETALADPESQVRRKALWALAAARLETAPTRAIDLLRDRASDVRAMAAWLLAEISDKASLPALRAAFDNERDSEAQKAEFLALVLLGDRSKGVVDQALASENANVREIAVRVMAGQRPINPARPWPDPRPSP